MNLCDAIANQSTIYYSQGKYNRLSSSKRLSSVGGRSPGNQTRGKESTKGWVARSFYSASPTAERNSTSVATKPKSPAATLDGRANENSGKDSPDKKKNSYHGKPAVFFEQSVIDSQAEKFKFCLVGKFPRWRPSLSQIREWATTKWKLKGQWSITLLDHCHVFIALDNEDDMLHVWARNRWFIGSHLMKVFKWFPTFVPANGEPSSAAVWVSLPSLPVAFFQEELLSPIAALAGKVLTIDGPTRNLSRTNVARACVEVDLLKDLPRQIWVGVGEGGFWQDLCYEKLPPYCTECRQQGHSTKACQANRSNSQNKTAKLKPSIKNPNSQIKEEGRSQEYFSRTKRVRISPIIEDKDDGNPITRQDLSQSQGKGKGKGKEVESTSERSLPLSLGGHSSGEQRAECSSAPTSKLVVLEEDPNQTDSEREDVPGANNVALHTEVRWKGIGLQQRGSSHLVEQISPPRKMKPSSKRPIFFWKTKQDFPVVELRPPTLMKYKYSEIKKMTKTFRDRIGQGGFGIVFKGTLLDGQEVAVKIGNKRARDEEFSNEMHIMRDISHANVVRLLGFCSEGSKRALVYEFMPNGSLDKIIYSNETKSSYSVQRSQQLCKIAVGVARGLDYLHRGCTTRILHFDIKPHNILLDQDFCPKISDFGLAKLSSRKDSVISMEGARGTRGYMAPELFLHGKVSYKSDVYGYGMMVLEMVERRKNLDPSAGTTSQIYIPGLIYSRLEDERDLELEGVVTEEDEKIARKMIIVGLWCTQMDPASRPSMDKVLEMLEGSGEAMQIPPRPFLSSPARSFDSLFSNEESYTDSRSLIRSKKLSEGQLDTETE